MTNFVKTTALAALALSMTFPVAGNALFKKAPAAAAKPVDCTKTLNKLKAACKKPAAATTTAPATGAATSTTTPAAPAMMGAMSGKRQHKPVATSGNIVTATDKNGKVVHYDCSKAGNKSKKACQGH